MRAKTGIWRSQGAGSDGGTSSTANSQSEIVGNPAAKERAFATTALSKS
ncbi:hypothetical protein HMPREF3198_01404 [Winkia neuii]|nr:hypothetical protein HMPREF3198_01404 [Winkia neuii]